MDMPPNLSGPQAHKACALFREEFTPQADPTRSAVAEYASPKVTNENEVAGLAGEIAQDVAIALALGSAAVGAAGSVISQIVGGIIASSRQKKQSAADEQRWQIDSDAKRRDRNLDHKIALFSKFLATVEGIRRQEGHGSPLSHSAYQAYEQTLDELRETVEEVGLVAPEIYEHARNTHISAARMLAHKVGDPIRLRSVPQAEQTLAFWIGLTRIASRAYINHEPVEWPEQAIADHYALLQLPPRYPIPSDDASRPRC